MAALVVLTTTDKREDAQRIARELIERRLAACVQIVGPVESVYRWQGAVETTQEWQCLAKTTDDQYAALEAAIVALHSYDTPEIIALPIEQASATYLAWLAGEVG
ncbi:MAG: divalent-cation tolerance protein CutA [Planctomycetales bacterium]|nr:divalent-cation tolerance protein CutA [Planctomycetales bacterium]